MDNLLKTDLVGVINQKRKKTLPEWTASPVVASEDIDEPIFDIVDRKNSTLSIRVDPNTGTATYYNCCGGNPCELHFIRFEEYMNQFGEYTKGLGRADFIVCEPSHKYFIIHEISEGNISSKRSKARSQLFSTLNLLYGAPRVKHFVEGFRHKICYLTATGDGPANSPMDMAEGFNEIYRHLPDPIPFNAGQITKRGFQALETRNIKLE